jgi:hypothetical protein
VQLAKPPLGGGGALQFPIKIRYRELKKAFMDSQDDNFMIFFFTQYISSFSLQPLVLFFQISEALA